MLEIKKLEDAYLTEFKDAMIEAFQKGAEAGGKADGTAILPEHHIDRALAAEGGQDYAAFEEGKLVGGALVMIDEKTHHNHLDFLFVRAGVESKGIGRSIWDFLEKTYPETEVWETMTPYFERRNIHFYINRLGFHVMEFFHKGHPDPSDPFDQVDEVVDGSYFDGMFRFEKRMK